MKFTGKEIASDQQKRRKSEKNSCAPEAISERIPSVRVDAHSKQLKGMAVGDKVTVTLVGNVTSVEINSYSSQFGLDVLSSEVKTGKNEFEKLADDE
jgi:hypothetical protein